MGWEGESEDKTVGGVGWERGQRRGMGWEGESEGRSE